MKKLVKLILFMLLMLSFMVQNVAALESVVIYGRTTFEALGVSVLALRQETDLKKIKAEDILYINQNTIDKDGRFAITLPLNLPDDCIIRSNMEFDVYDGEEKGTVYVSPLNGNDGNDGTTAETAFATLDGAYSQLFRTDEIIILDDVTFVAPGAYNGSLTFKGNTADVKLNLPSEISMNGDLTFDNLTLNNSSTIYANGYSLKITDTVSSAEERLTVFGGRKGMTLVGDTNLTLLGGKYNTIYGGGNSGAVEGNTNIVFGGNVNTGDRIDDQSETISPCYVFGGGYNATVTGGTSITLEGNAVAKYIVGAGNGANGTATNTNIFINGGKVMNVYGGSLSAALTCNTHITMAGGLAEALFGGSYVQPLTGNTTITLKGGNVSRRVYSGCYNDFDIGALDYILGGSGTWGSDHHVTGTTTIVIYPEVKLNTKDELSSKNAVNVGVFSGSRAQATYNNERNTIICLNGAYQAQKSCIGDKSGFDKWLKSFENYTIDATVGGVVSGTEYGGTIKIIPQVGYVGNINGVNYESEGTATITDNAVVSVVFEAKPYNINSLTATKSETSVSGTADIMGSDNELNPTLWISVFEGDSGRLISCASQNAASGGIKPFTLDCDFEEGKKYIIKAMLWNGTLEPLTTYYTLELK